jgi:hypothetical protein
LDRDRVKQVAEVLLGAFFHHLSAHWLLRLVPNPRLAQAFVALRLP